MRRDVVNLIFDHLAFFQSFSTVKVYTPMESDNMRGNSLENLA